MRRRYAKEVAYWVHGDEYRVQSRMPNMGKASVLPECNSQLFIVRDIVSAIDGIQNSF